MPNRPHFDYRIVKKYYDLSYGQKEPYYTICRVWYDMENGGQIQTFSEEGVAPTGDSLEFLQSELTLMQKAFNKPILEEVEIDKCVVELVEIDEIWPVAEHRPDSKKAAKRVN